MDYLEVVKCKECGNTNHLDRYSDDECYKCGAELELPNRRTVGRVLRR